MTIQLKNKPEHITQTYNFKHVINHVDIIQAEAEFIEKYGHLLDNNNLITRTLVDYEAKTITIEAYSTIYPRKDNRRGFIFDLKEAVNLNIQDLIKDLIKVFKSIGIIEEDFKLYPNSNHLVTTSNKLTKEIIESAKEVIELENRTQTFLKTYHFDKRPTIQNLLDSQLKFITDNKLHEDDIIYVGINTDNEDSVNNNTIIITGRQSAKHKTYTDDVAAIINSCIIVDRFDSCRHSAINTGGYDNLIERIISYQYPIVDSNSLDLLESSVNITQVLEDISNKEGHINSTSSNVLEVNEEDIAEFITDMPHNVDELIAETKAYHELQIRKDNSYSPPKDLVFTEDEIQKLKDFLKSL